MNHTKQTIKLVFGSAKNLHSCLPDVCTRSTIFRLLALVLYFFSHLRNRIQYHEKEKKIIKEKSPKKFVKVWKIHSLFNRSQLTCSLKNYNPVKIVVDMVTMRTARPANL